MRIHHLNCGCMCPLGGKLFDGFSRGLTAQLACHCLLIETDQHGLVLVDTGFGTCDVAYRGRRLSPFFRLVNNIKFERRYTAYEQVRALGFSAADVRHIVLTHLDFDHAGGLDDFPQARVHVMQEEMDAAQSQSSLLGRHRYRLAQWQKVKDWRFYRAGGEPWFGFQAVHGLDGLPPELLLIPLRGHTHGHAGVAVNTGGSWLLHAGDAYFYREEMGQMEPHCTPGLRLYQNMMEVDRTARLSNQQRLWALSVERRDEVRVFCSHDAKELEQLQQAGRATGGVG